ncbi:MAG: hypothetical protein ACYTAF_07545 [Planctomycetota bacterium]|jgi:HEAT repeat protein
MHFLILALCSAVLAQADPSGVFRKHRDDLLGRDGVVGVGLAEGRIRIVATNADDIRKALGSRLEGTPLRVEVYDSSGGDPGEGWKEAKKRAAEALADSNSFVRFMAVRKLAPFRREEAVRLLVRLYECASKHKLKAMDLLSKVDTSLPLADDEIRRRFREIWEEDGIQRGIVEALEGQDDPAAIRLLVERTIGSEDWPVRAICACALGRAALHTRVGLQGLRDAESVEEDPRVVAEIVESLGRLWDRESVGRIGGDRLAAPCWQVRLAAVEALGRTGDPRGIGHLVGAMDRLRGRIRGRANAALVALTGVDKHGDPEIWRAWWKDNKEKVLSGKYVRPAGAKPPGPGRTTFYGIPVVSTRMAFLLDLSGSMREPAGWKPEGMPAEGEQSKLDVLKHELASAVRGMREEARFGVIGCRGSGQPWRNMLLPASARNKERAVKYIESRLPMGATDVYDGLVEAFKIHAPGPVGDSAEGGPDPGYLRGVDTVYVLSDGRPTVGLVTDPKDILREVARVNRWRRIVIHTVAIGANADADFLKALAERNGGVFIRRE